LRVIGPPVGWVDDREKWRLLRSARGLVHASLLEGFGLPVLEAMAHGVPVLASEDRALAELAAGAALHVDAHDVGALARGLVALHTDAGLRSRLRAAGLERSAAFTPQRSALLWQAAHERVLAGPARVAAGAVADP
jgi:glycosyltransferase involved in cell wall biosynthesis